MAVAESCFIDVADDAVVGGTGIDISYETFFQQYVAGGISRLPASPLVARGWAAAIAACWRSWQAKGVVDAHYPLLVREIVAGDGHFTALMWRALRQAFSTLAVAECSFRYVVHLAPGTPIDEWLAEAGLAQAPGLAVTTSLPWEENDRGMQPDSHGPMVLLAYGYLHAQACALRAVHYGQWLEGRVTFDSPQTFTYVWMPLDSETTVSALLKRRYQRTLTSASVQVPVMGLHMLENVRKASGGHFLWLAADHGVTRESDIRLGALLPYSGGDAESAAACVNFHAFAFDALQNGEWVYQEQMIEQGVVTQAIWGNATQSMGESEAAAISALLRDAHPDTAFRCVDLARELPAGTPAASYLALLHATDYDTEIVRHVLEEWVDAPPALAAAEQVSWQQALEQVWSRCSRGACDLPFRHRLGVLAARWGYLGLARSVFEADAHFLCLASCEWLGGRSEHAWIHLSRLPEDDCDANAFRQEWMARAHRWQALGWYDPACACDGDLSIEPLGPEHAQAFHVHYADPQVGVLTRLPELDTVDDVCAWMATQEQDPYRATYAVMHADAGFVGVVSCHAWRDAGYFYFWIGNERQGNGYGRRAARLLFKQAESRGMRWLFTSAYQENARSIEALENVGFRRLDVSAASPDEDLVFFVYGPDEGPAARGRLAALLAELNSSMVLKDEWL